MTITGFDDKCKRNESLVLADLVHVFRLTE